MTNKEFKQLIKKHQVKQSFVRLLPGIILRFYKDTITEDLWCSRWAIEEGKAVKITIVPIDRYIWAYHWHKYVNDCHNLRGKVNKESNLIFKTKDIEQYDMQQRKFWKIWYSTINFMIHDKRVE